MERKIVDSIQNRLNKAMIMRGYRQIDLVEKTGIPKGSISQYILGNAEPKNDRIYMLAKALDVSEAWLIGLDVPMEREKLNINTVEVNAPTNDAMARRLMAYFEMLTDAEKFDLLANLARSTEGRNKT